ncbi:hypothetical protein LR48_Vigan549s010000 [Vigna angularis]|uniref:Uncharacterized protein n=1 Tax=Phaseolus angularis TaxID=3914 RepID=A0A0L9TD60_PHAAN|nr:uncharacterized protein HKW66_Vig0107210 [Vigna angularis]KOM28545.1 hypothetical protein LR48_Vigan549s010000 [Vigna angularis]
MEAVNLGWCRFSSVSEKKGRQRRMVRRRCELSGGDRNYRWGRMVDEGMIVLRWRIKEMKMLEKEEAASDWMEWEKQYGADYQRHLLHAMDLLQSYFIGLRPSVALGMLFLVAFSVFMFSAFGLCLALQAAYNLVSCFGSSR